MKILQLGKFYPIRGGVEKVMWDLTKGLGAKGVKCDMLCACLPGDVVDYKDRDFRSDPTSDLPKDTRIFMRLSEHSRVICVPAMKKVAATMISPAMVKALRHMLRQAEKDGEPYDLVHVHHPDPMAALALFLSGWKGKVVLHWHSDIVKQKTMLKLFLPLQRWLIRRADRIVGTTPVYVAESPYLSKVQNKVTYLPIGVDQVNPSCEGIQRIHDEHPGKRLVFSLGRLVHYKGYQYLVEAAKYLPDSYHIVIGGQGPLRSELEALAQRLGVADRVTFKGWMPDEDAADWFAAADVFVLSSVMKTEAFAIVQVEAMSCGTPVVATKIPGSGVSWVNANGVSGLNVPICDSEVLAAAIQCVCSRRDEFGTAARLRYEENFTFDCMIERCHDIYRSI